MQSQALILLLSLVPSVLGQSCTDFSTFVYVQANLDALSKCPTLSGDVYIYRDFRGNVVLPGVVSGTSIIAGNPGASHSTPTLGPTYVESISLPDLTDLSGGIRISGAEYLTALSAPKLKYSGGGMEVSDTKLTSISFPALEKIDGSSYFDGSFDELSLPKLTSATSIRITTTGNLDCQALYTSFKSVKFTSVDTPYSSVFYCSSAKGTVQSGVTSSSTTAASTSASSTSIGSSTTAPSASSTTTPGGSSRPSSTLSTSTGGVRPSSTTTQSGGSGSSTTAPINGGGNGTISRTSTRAPTATGSTTPITANSGSMMVAGVWSTVSSIAAIAIGMVLL